MKYYLTCNAAAFGFSMWAVMVVCCMSSGGFGMHVGLWDVCLTYLLACLSADSVTRVLAYYLDGKNLVLRYLCAGVFLVMFALTMITVFMLHELHPLDFVQFIAFLSMAAVTLSSYLRKRGQCL